ncbi:MAG: SDR family NAD(P)-dependent oxidoreductase [Oceanicoccus sp.]
MKLENKTVLITGGGTGIGRALAIQLAKAGSRVLICGRNKDSLLLTASYVPKKIDVVVADITKQEDRNVIREAVTSRGVTLDILINNAGIQNEMSFSEWESASNISSMIELETATNFSAPILLTLHLLDHMSKSGGAVVNVTSLLALHPKASAPVYCATKAGLRSFTRSLRHQLAVKGISVIEVVPPLVETSMTDGHGSGKITADQAAIEIVEGLQKRKELIKVGKSKIVYLLDRFFPEIIAKMMMRA